MPQPTKPARPGAEVIDSGYAWLRMGLCVLLATVGNVGMWAYVVVLPAVQAEFGVERGLASLPYVTTMAGFALGNVLIGRHVDRFGVALPVAGAGIALGSGFILSSFTTSIWQFSLSQGVLVGIGASASFGPLIADISRWFSRRRGIAVAVVASGNYLAGVVWPAAINLLLASVGWRGGFVLIGLLCVAAILPLSLFLRARAPEFASEAVLAADGTPRGSGLKPIDLSPRTLQILLIVAGLGCCVAMSMPQVHIVAYVAGLGYGVAQGAQMLSLMLAGGIVSRLASGLIADRIGGVRTLLLGSAMQCIALILYLPFDGLAALYVVSFVFGLSQGGIVPSYALIVREYLPAREAGQRVGLVIMATITGMALGGWLSGFIYDLTGSYRAAFINGIGWNLMNIAVMTTVLLRTRTAATMATAAR